MERRLAAILAADVGSYSRLMEADEAGTLTALISHRQDLFNHETAECRGRVIKLMVDSASIEFGGVVNALPVTVVPLSFWPRADWGVAVREGAA